METNEAFNTLLKIVGQNYVDIALLKSRLNPMQGLFFKFLEDKHLELISEYSDYFDKTHEKEAMAAAIDHPFEVFENDAEVSDLLDQALNQQKNNQ
jgi:hypothetical protein